MYCVADALTCRLMFALQVDNLAIVLDTRKEGLTPVPRKVDHRTGRRLYVLDYVFFEKIVRHPGRFIFAMKHFFPKVITVAAREIASRADRFHEDLKIP